MIAADHGTLVIILIWRDGIYLSADSRRGKVHDDAEKLVRLGPQTLLGLRGHAMLFDGDADKSILASVFFQDKLSGPIIVKRFAPDAPWQERDKARVATASHVQKTLEPFVDAYAHEWNDVELTADAIAVIKSRKAILGLTLAQWEPDGWLLAMDLEHCVRYDESERVVITPVSAPILLLGPYTEDKIQAYWPPDCDKIIGLGPPAEDGDPVAFLQLVFKAVIDASEHCAENIGLPVDIAKVHLGTITPLVMKKPWPTG
jgi:hypothetical protein